MVPPASPHLLAGSPSARSSPAHEHKGPASFCHLPALEPPCPISGLPQPGPITALVPIAHSLPSSLVSRLTRSPTHTAFSSCRPGFHPPRCLPRPPRDALPGRPAQVSPRGLPLPGAGSPGKMTSCSLVSWLLGFAPGRPGGQAPTDSAVYEPRATGHAPQNGHSMIQGPHGRTAASPVPTRRGGGVSKHGRELETPRVCPQVPQPALGREPGTTR